MISTALILKPIHSLFVEVRLLGIFALLRPTSNRERFVGEVLANMAELRWRQLVEELLWVAAAVPGDRGDPAAGAAAAG